MFRDDTIKKIIKILAKSSYTKREIRLLKIKIQEK